MLIGYGNYQLTFSSISASPAGADILTDPLALFDGRSGSGSSFRWGGSPQTTASYVQMRISIASPLDAVAPIGVVGIVNVQGLPAGTLIRIGTSANIADSIPQRLTVGFRGELSAWFIPTAAMAGNVLNIWFVNDVNGVAGVLPSTVFASGEIFAGRLTSVPTLRKPGLSEGMSDSTGWSTTDGGQFHALMRKVAREVSNTVGLFTPADAKVSARSRIKSGGNPDGTICMRDLAGMIATSPVIAVCDMPHTGIPAPIRSAAGYKFDPVVIQSTMMLARPTQIGELALTHDPYFSQPLRFGEAR